MVRGRGRAAAGRRKHIKGSCGMVLVFPKGRQTLKGAKGGLQGPIKDQQNKSAANVGCVQADGLTLNLPLDPGHDSDAECES